jgi:glycosyltransferase involved in cell wall biosynthesis
MDRPAQMGLDRKIGRAEFVAAVCWYGRSQMLRWVPRALWSRIFVVHCGLERGYGDAASPAVQTSARLLCIGRLSKEKGQLLLVEAAAQLAAAGLPVDIVMVGDGPLRGEIEALIERSGLRGRVRIAGWLDARQIRQQIADARALVVPSLSEGLPVVIMEAMASGRPVVAPFLAGIPELVTEGRTGWLYPAGSVSALSEALRLCLGTPAEQLESMGLQARARVRADHDVDVEAGKLAELLAPTGGEGLHGGEAV